MSIYIDFHVLQTVPPSCVNRDDTGSPKTAVYGGAVRARVSSQAWKHAMREEFKNEFEIGYRTKHIKKAIANKVQSFSPDLINNEIEKTVEKILKTKLKENGKQKAWFEFEDDEKTKALFFISNKQIEKFAELLISNEEDIKKYRDALKDNPSVDIALFGRMAASDPTLNFDAAAQVAHAISTHAVQNEYDYFTAVDDLQKDDNAGAGHLGTVEFNSSTLYRYATVNASELSETLGRECVAEVVKKFGQAFICSMPTGKENTFANRTFPDAVYITIRNDQPVNLCGAFEAPVKRSENGYAEISEKKLAEYAEKIYARFAAKPVKAFCIGDSFGENAVSLSLKELLTELEKAVSAEIEEV
jgi:CRISPR system Cascade subunit CasC